MSKVSIFTLSRRNFLSGVALGTLSLLTKDLINPASAWAEGEEATNNPTTLENYHIFIPLTTAIKGGKETLTLRSGDTCFVPIPSRAQDSQEIKLAGQGQDGKDIVVTLHTLYDRQTRIADKIYQEIDKNTQFIEESSKNKCKDVYEQVEEAETIQDLIALDLLDYIIQSSNLDSKIKERYQIASKNSRLLKIHQAIESALGQSELTDAEKKLIQGTYAYIRAGEPVPDFKALTDIDTIVASSALPLETKQTYYLASVKSRAMTVDFILVKLINENQNLTPEQKENYLSTYKQVRAGNTVEDEATLKSLDSFIRNADILENAKLVYSIVRQQNLDKQENFAKKVDAVLQNADAVQEQLDRAKNRGAAIVPQLTKALTAAGAETATGVSFSTFYGAAATNATLAFFGGGSVASGGLGMLGGLAVVTGGAALVGAAGVVSIALVSQMDSEDKKNLGIAIGTGTIAGAATVLAAWTAASALGVTGTLSGAAAITVTMSALGGLSVITGGAALVASGTAFLIWSFLKAGKKRDQSELSQLETRTYTYTEETIPGYLGEFLQKNIPDKYSFQNAFSAPHIPLDRLSSALSAWLSVNSDEKVIALIDTSGFWGKAGIVFTDGRLLWKNNSTEYKDLARFFQSETKLASLLSEDKQQKDLSLLKKVVDILSDENYATNLSKLQELVALTYDDNKLSELVSNPDKNTLDLLKYAVDTLANKKSNYNLPSLKLVVDIISDLPDVGKFFSSQLVSQLSNEQYRKDLSNFKEVVDMLSDEAAKDNLTELLREVGQKYSLA